jgi:glycosyltransferase involved in cell wall biosynthesis
VQALRAPRPGAAAAKWAHARYSWDVVAGKYLDFFGEVLAQA